MPLTTIRPAALAATLLAVTTSAMAAPVPGRGTWETTLQSRDINGDGTTDAWYDTVRNITWLANPRMAAGTAFDDGFSPTDGRLTFAGAATWLAALDVHGVTGWRFGHEVDDLYYATLGNHGMPTPDAGWYNTGPFVNVTNAGSANSGWYWLGVPPYIDPSCGPGCPTFSDVFWADGVGAGYYTGIDTSSSMGVWAVHDGDVPVAVVPEPETWALMLAGLAALGVVARRRQ